MPDGRPDRQLGEELQTPAGHYVFATVSSVGIVEIEDREDRFRLDPVEPFRRDVDPPVGVGREDVTALVTKGTSTCALYSASASSLTISATAKLERRYSLIVPADTGIALAERSKMPPPALMIDVS